MRTLRKIAIAVAVALAVGAIALLVASVKWWREGREIAAEHRAHLVSHPGWSFPARVLSRPLPADAPAEHRAAHARALGVEPSQFEGRELPPVRLGWVIGPDAEVREHLPIEEAPQHLIDAILVAEDREFWEHSGVNFSALVRASLENVKERGYSQGASTLTMQLIRSLNQRRERTLMRKWREMIMALATDRVLGKHGVLEMYLDAPYLGQSGGLSICGFRAAARHYFGKEAAELSLAEAATLAAILPAPGRFAPDRHPELAEKRRDRLLKEMQDNLHYDVTAALAEPMRTVDLGQGALRELFPSYLSVVRAELERRIDPATLYGSGLTVTTEIDIYMQHETEHLFRTKTKYFQTIVAPPKKALGRLEAAGVLLDVESGAIRAVYGGSDHSTDFNRATHARRQGGSAFKPVVYALALNQLQNGKPRFTASTIEPNSPRVFKTAQGNWSPRNVMSEYTETACLAYALAWSQNIATASLLEAAGGPDALIAFASKLGFDSSHYPREMGLALGQGEVTVLEMTEFAAMIARGGRPVVGSTLFSAVDVRGREHLPPPSEKREPVLQKETAALLRELMRLVIDYGTGGAVRGVVDPGYRGPAMGKTGTTDGEKDLWFVGATPRYAAALWLGYDHPTSIGASASDLASPLWGWWLHRISLPDGPPPKFREDPKLITRSVCTITGRVAGPTCKAIPAPYLPGTEPKDTCPIDHDLIGETEVHPELPAAHESLWKKLGRVE